MAFEITLVRGLIYFAFFQIITASPKIESENTKLDQKWPNFFNPKQSILRDTKDKDEEKMERKYAKVTPEGFEEENVEENEEKTTLDEELIDYTLKGGLRGTYFILNATDNNNMDNLSYEAQSVIRKILTENKEVLGELRTRKYEGEKTDEGIRLRTPLVTKTRTNSMGKYGAQISYYANDVIQSFIHFGNWCGKGGRSAPVDNIDGCCLEQEKCYGRQIRQCPDVWKKPYSHMYAWISQDGKQPACIRSESLCVNHVCGCDLDAAICFAQLMATPSEIPLHMVQDATVSPPNAASENSPLPESPEEDEFVDYSEEFQSEESFENSEVEERSDIEENTEI